MKKKESKNQIDLTNSPELVSSGTKPKKLEGDGNDDIIESEIEAFTYLINDPNNYQLITGDENGRITIWNLKTGKPIYLWEAHPKSAITKIWYQPEYHIL